MSQQKFKPGDWARHPRHGWVKVSATTPDTWPQHQEEAYPVTIGSVQDRFIETFTGDGKRHKEDLFPTLLTVREALLLGDAGPKQLEEANHD